MPPAFNLSQDQTLQFDTVCLITLAGIERFLADVSISKLSFHCVSTNALSSARSIAVRLFDLVAPFIKRPHLSAVSFLKNEARVVCAFDVAAMTGAAKGRDYGGLRKCCQAALLVRVQKHTL